MTLEQVAQLNSLPPPEPARVKKCRELVKLSQREAALVIGQTKRSWQYYESGARKMPAAKFMRFLTLTADRREKPSPERQHLADVLNSPEHRAWVRERNAYAEARQKWL